MSDMEGFFAGNHNPRFTASAPGILDIMGGSADYAGSLVLQMPIRQRNHVTIARRDDGAIRIQTGANPKNPPTKIVSSELPKPGSPADWVAYVKGCLWMLRQEKGVEIAGADIWVDLQVAAGKGVASSSALSVAMFRALAQAYSLAFEGNELPILVQKVERLIAGAPCQFTAPLACHFGELGKVLPILCQPDHISDPFPIPEGLHFVGIDSGKRNLTEKDACEAGRTASFMGYTLLALQEGAYAHELQLARETGEREHLLYNGYLANITPREFEDRYAWLPQQLKGSDFTDKYVTIDPLTEVKPDAIYNVLQATRHPVYEHTRTQYFSLLLQHFPLRTDPEMREKSLRQLGSWMRQSHEDYAARGLGSPEADALVRLADENAGNGVYGARLTGDNAVYILCEGEKGLETVHGMHEAYQQKSGERVDLFV